MQVRTEKYVTKAHAHAHNAHARASVLRAAANYIDINTLFIYKFYAL